MKRILITVVATVLAIPAFAQSARLVDWQGMTFYNFSGDTAQAVELQRSMRNRLAAELRIRQCHRHRQLDHPHPAGRHQAMGLQGQAALPQ
jgi:hypothetical protein